MQSSQSNCHNLDCLFCSSDFLDKAKIICESDNFLAFYDEYPVSNGHTLIIPKKHIQSLFQLDEKLVVELWNVMNNVTEYLDAICKPTAYNIGVNNGKDAGQTIQHLHIHIIPRYENDGGLPCGVRNVFRQEKANYIKHIQNEKK